MNYSQFSDQLERDDMYAYSLQSAFMDSLRCTAPDVAPDALVSLQNSILAYVKNSATARSSGTRRDFLMKAVNSVEKALIALGDGKITAEEANILIDLKARASQSLCSFCYREGFCSQSACRADVDMQSEINTCLGDFEYCLRLAADISRKAYEVYLPFLVSELNIRLETAALARSPGQIPSIKLCVNASTFFDDTDEIKVSHIKTKIAVFSLDRASLAALPYVLLHEVLCHAYQMICSSRKRENPGGIIDPVSEGMVDALAVKLLHDRASDPSITNMNEIRLRRSEADIATQIHLARSSLDLYPRFPEAPAVALGASIVRAVHALYQSDSKSPRSAESLANADYDTWRFVCALNVHPWGYLSRYEGLTKLALALTSHRDSDLFALLLRVRSTGRVCELITYLSNWIPGVPKATC